MRVITAGILGAHVDHPRAALRVKMSQLGHNAQSSPHDA